MDVNVSQILSADVYFYETSGYDIVDRYRANQPNVVPVLNEFTNLRIKEGRRPNYVESSASIGQDVEMVHIPSIWTLETVGQSGYRVTLSVGFPVIPQLYPEMWIELRLYLTVTSQHDDIAASSVSIDYSPFYQKQPKPEIQPLPTGDTNPHISSYLAVLVGKARDVLDQCSLFLHWDVHVHGTPTAASFGQEITAYVVAVAKKLVIQAVGEDEEWEKV